MNITSATVFSAAVGFVNNPKMKIIVLTCNTVTEKLVDSTVTIDDKNVLTTDDTKATLTGTAFDSLCGTGGAVYDNSPVGHTTAAPWRCPTKGHCSRDAVMLVTAHRVQGPTACAR